MSGSGLEDILKLIYTENCVNNIMPGHAYTRAVRSHILVHLALAKTIMDYVDDRGDEEIDAIDATLNDIDRTTILDAAEREVLKIMTSKFKAIIEVLEKNGPNGDALEAIHRG